MNVIYVNDKQAARKYNGAYLLKYERAEKRNAKLYWILGGTDVTSTGTKYSADMKN